MPTKIEWSDETWNPTVGCARVSPGCDHCYAIGVAHRKMQPAHEGLTIRRPGQLPDWTGRVRCLPDRLEQPLRWKRPRRIFVDSMSDLFHKDVPVSFIQDVIGVMARTPQHTYQVLTKRPHRMQEVIIHHGGPMPLGNVWLGTSIENDRYTFRADQLRGAPAVVRFLSLEPLLGPLPSLDLSDIDWVIVGGESGAQARPMHPDWVRDIRDRCVAAGVPFFLKQWGSWGPARNGDEPGARHEFPGLSRSGLFSEPSAIMVKRDKKANGRILDGRTWDEMPGAAT